MSISFMVTNGGPHPPEKWADVTARQIADLIVIEPSAQPQAFIDKRDFETALFKLLLELHTHVRDRAKSHLKETNQVDHRLAHDRGQDAADKIAALAQGTRFAEHFNKPEVRAVIHNITGQHFADSIHVERGWHADRKRKV